MIARTREVGNAKRAVLVACTKAHALRRPEREAAGSLFIFVSERGAPLSTRGFRAMVERAGQTAGFDMKLHPHMLRHACG
jgi:site-specific recombinase XerD